VTFDEHVYYTYIYTLYCSIIVCHLNLEPLVHCSIYCIFINEHVTSHIIVTLCHHHSFNYCFYLPVILFTEEILHQLIGSLSHYLQGFVHPRWWSLDSWTINSSHARPFLCFRGQLFCWISRMKNWTSLVASVCRDCGVTQINVFGCQCGPYRSGGTWREKLFLLLSIGFWKVKPHGHLPGYRSIGVFELISQRRAMRIDVVSAPILKSQWGILGFSTCESANGVEVGNCTRTWTWWTCVNVDVMYIYNILI